jgi:hypothetical protein
MADEVWGRARIPTGESVAAALRLARELRPDDCLLCDREDRATELLVRKDGDFRRYVAYESGATQQVEARPPTARFRGGRRLAYAGLLCVPLIIALGFVFKPENSTLWIGGPFAVAMGLVLCGAIVQKHHDLDALVPGGAAPARIPYDLDGWASRTAAQLGAVGQLAKAGEGHAYVLDLPDGAVDVETIRKRNRHRQVIDARGAVVEEQVTALPGGVYWAERIAALAFVIPLLALLLVDGFRYFVAGIVVCLLIGAVASRFERRKHQPRAGEEWFRVELEAPSGD